MSLLPVLNSAWRVPVILLITFGLATVSVVCSFVDSSGRIQHRCARGWGTFVLWVSRVRVVTRGMERLNPQKGYVLLANHLSMFDHWAFLGCLPFHFGFAAKSSIFSIPLLGWHLSQSGSIPVDRKKPRETLRSFVGMREKIRQGLSIVIYPEGERTFGDSFAPFKRGAFLLARSSGAPIVPVTIIGAHRRLRRGSIIIHPGVIEMIFHPVLEFEEYKELNSRQISRKVRKIIKKSYRQVAH